MDESFKRGLDFFLSDELLGHYREFGLVFPLLGFWSQSLERFMLHIFF